MCMGSGGGGVGLKRSDKGSLGPSLAQPHCPRSDQEASLSGLYAGVGRGGGTQPPSPL